MISTQNGEDSYLENASRTARKKSKPVQIKAIAGDEPATARVVDISFAPANYRDSKNSRGHR